MEVEGFILHDVVFADGERVSLIAAGVVREGRIEPDVAQVEGGPLFSEAAVRKVIDDLMHGDEEGTEEALKAIRAASPAAAGFAGYSDDELKGTARDAGPGEAPTPPADAAGGPGSRVERVAEGATFPAMLPKIVSGSDGKNYVQAEFFDAAGVRVHGLRELRQEELNAMIADGERVIDHGRVS